jgi:hypothetical protein
VAQAVLAPEVDDAGHEVGAGDPLRAGGAVAPLPPGDGRAVREVHPCLVEGVPQAGVALREREAVDAGQRGVPALPRQGALDHGRGGSLEVTGIELGAHHGARVLWVVGARHRTDH